MSGALRSRAASGLVLAGGATVALASVPVLAPDDPLRPLLLLIPAMALALRLLDESSRTRAAQRFQVAHGLALVALTTLACVRSTLGLGNLDRLIIAALLVLLASYLRGLVPSLRRRLGPRVPRRPDARFFWLPLVIYLGLLPWSNAQRPPDGDEPYYLLLTHSLAHDLDVDLANNYAQEDWRHFLDRPIEPQPGDPRGPDGAVYSRHNLLLPLVLAPFYRLAGLAGVLAAMAAMAAATAWMVLRLAHHVAPRRPRGALWTYGLFALAPPFVLYSQQVWIEVPAALVLTLAVDRVWAARRSGLGRRQAWALTALLAVLPLLKLRLALLAGGLLILVWRDHRRAGGRSPLAGRGLVAVVAGLVAILGAILLANQLRFANPLKMHSLQDLRLVDQPPSSFVLGGLGMFYDVAYGLFACAPLWALLIPALWHMARGARSLARDLAVVAGPYLLLVAPRIEWYGGWSPPFRYGLVLLPLLALPLVALLDRPSTRARSVLGALAGVTGCLTVLWLTVPGWTYNLADGGNHLLDASGARLGADVARFFPSMVRPRLATWLWPVASLLLVPLVLTGGRRKRPHRVAWGPVAMLLGITALTLAIHRVPTRTIELEDGWVQHHGGALHPPPWTLERPRHRGGWLFGTASHASAAVVGDGPVRLRIALRYIDNRPDPEFAVTVAAGEQVLHRFTHETPTAWQTVEIGPFDWPPRQPLVIYGPPAARGRRNGIVIDYVDFLWQ